MYIYRCVYMYIDVYRCIYIYVCEFRLKHTFLPTRLKNNISLDVIQQHTHTFLSSRLKKTHFSLVATKNTFLSSRLKNTLFSRVATKKQHTLFSHCD